MSYSVMEISPPDDEGDPPLLIDSDTESYTESPIIEEESEQSDKFVLSPFQSDDAAILCDIDSDTNVRKPFRISSRNLLDKAISVDEESLDTPLEPLKYVVNHSKTSVYEQHILSCHEITNFESMQVIKEHEYGNIDVLTESTNLNEDLPYSSDISECHSNKSQSENVMVADKTIPSILRRQSCYDQEETPSYDCSILPITVRKVSFPSDALLATYRDAEFPKTWNINEFLSSKEILQEYQDSCKRHQTIELDVIKDQILEIKNNQNRSAVLNLTSITISRDVCETLEDLLKVVNFRSIIINECKFTPETIREFLNMLEYYESVSELVISQAFEDEVWKTLCLIIGKSYYLESITFKEMNINEAHMRFFLNAIKLNERITTLKFDSCALVKLPSFYLVENLTYITSVRELYLPQTGLYTKEAEYFKKFLSKNSHLQVLDISNNSIGDRGLDVLANGLTKQNTDGPGLSVLIVFNNQLTEKSGPTICNIIAECKNLHTLNIGFNNLTDEVLPKLKEGLCVTKSLEGLGLQSTLLTCIGVSVLAEAIESNHSLLKINLKGNKAIQKEGLENLSRALTNSKVVKVEIDETNRSCNDPQGFAELVQKIYGICTINKSLAEQSIEDQINLSQLIARKVSLSCEPRFITPPILLENSISGSRIKSPNPSPMPSPGCSPAPRSRFHVSKVPDKSPPSPSYSRFKVFAVTSPLATPVSSDNASVSSPPADEDEEEENRFSNVRSSVSSIDSVDSLTPPRDNFRTCSPTTSGESE